MSCRIGITLGDVTGVGPEVTLKALAEVLGQDETRYLLMGDEAEVQRVNERFGLKLSFSGAQSDGRLCIANSFGESVPEKLPGGSPLAARAAVAWLADGAQRCLRQELDEMVSAPVHKDPTVRAGHACRSQPDI